MPCVASRVDPEPHLLSEWQAFAELRTDRPVGFNVGAIPWSSIDAYARRHAIEGDDFHRFVSLIRALDIAERAHLRKKQPDADT